jgi:hypothetical protein
VAAHRPVADRAIDGPCVVAEARRDEGVVRLSEGCQLRTLRTEIALRIPDMVEDDLGCLRSRDDGGDREPVLALRGVGDEHSLGRPRRTIISIFRIASASAASPSAEALGGIGIAIEITSGSSPLLSSSEISS